MDGDEEERIRSRVVALLRSGFLGREPDPTVQIGAPIVVSHPEGGQHSWFVPLLRGTKLAGFAQLLPSLAPLGISSFPPGRLPDAADWIDSDRVRERAASLRRDEERLSEPVLSYDQQPARLAWQVVATSPSGASRILYVAGDAIYESRGSGLAGGG